MSRRYDRERTVVPDHGTTGPTSSTVLESSLLGWSDKQAHILSGAGRSNDLYRAPLFPFQEDELPHYHKSRGSTHEVFQRWRQQGAGLGTTIAGAWRRPLFVGGWTHSDDGSLLEGETTFNLQTPSFFLDMRVPKASSARLGHHRGFETMTDFELRLFARRHAFAGYTRVELTAPVSAGDAAAPGGGGGNHHGGARGLVATRHHAIDWNYIGVERPRPNKWRVEIGPDGNAWKEWGFAKDEFGQHVYMERWERLPAGGGPFLALRRRPAISSNRRVPDALLVVCGDHFGLIVDRPPELMERGHCPAQATGGRHSAETGLVGLVDAALERGDRDTAVAYLSLEASHGRISGQGECAPWAVECSLHPWLQGARPLLGAMLTVSPDNMSLLWRHQRYDSSGGDRGNGLHSEQKPSEGHSERFSDRFAEPRWTRASSLEGMWDVVESTLEGNGALEALFTSSGACVVRGGRKVAEGGRGVLRANL